MPTYEQLYHLKLSNLKAAAERWEETVTKFKGLHTAYGDQVASPFRQAGWTQPVLTAAKADNDVRAAHQEFEDAHKEAKGIAGVLTTLHAELKKAKNDLHHLADVEAKQQDLLVSPTGTVTPRYDLSQDVGASHDPDGQGAIREQQEACDAFARRIDRVLQRAAAADDTACWALRRDLGGDKTDFNSKVVTSLDDADATRALELAQKGSDMSDSELRKFNELLRANKNDKEFAEKFTTGMGGRGTLEFWEGMDLHGDPAPEGARKELLEQTRSQLGGTLATATESDSRAMREWKEDVIAAGPYPLDHDLNKPRGFQVMSDLMNSGRYDSAFLKDYGNALIDYEKDATKNGDSLSNEYLGKTIPGSGLDGGDIDLTNDWGTDPMTGYMNALGHNHQASTEFFSDKGNFDYVVGGDGVKGARDWPEDAHPQYENGTSRGYNALGHALESATTGSDYGAAKPELHRGEEERAVMQRVMERYGDPEVELMDKQTGISDSMGRIGAAYIDDLNYGISGLDASDQSQRGMEELFGVKDENRIEPVAAQQFVRELGNDETSHGIMSQAQQAFTTSRIQAHEGTAEAYRAAEWGMTMHGALDEARAEQIGRDYRESDEDYNHELAKSAAWKQAGVSVTVGGATTGVEAAATILAPQAAPIILPIAEAAGSAVETGLGNEIADSLKENERDSTGKAINSIDEFDYESKKLARTGIDNYMDSQGVVGASRDTRNTALDAAYARGSRITDTDNSR
ncbi:hypothetical protein [Streptomyces acidicola]|uniref:AG2 protein n=1 Tax=Streptomyces acidicola TaxID=2596892 RepID=A0A5N8WS28_9ACTN|nr:hypothetical protein [Streptomyces acidicola]MPY49616.1 hypothetical protein [Streptomyces acidicola]